MKQMDGSEKNISDVLITLPSELKCGDTST